VKIAARDDEVGGFHFFDPGIQASIFATDDDRFATAIKSKTLFAYFAQPSARAR
jgi:hypothetical protein